MRRLETTFDYWEGWVEDRTLVTRFGRIGLTEHPTVRWMRASPEAAMDALARAAGRRLARGMAEVDFTPPAVRSPSLEARIHEQPDDVDAWRIYADWLQEGGGEPLWGRLIGVEIDLAIDGDTPARLRERHELRTRLYRHIGTLTLYPTDRPPAADDFDRANLRFGFIESYRGSLIVGPRTAWRFAREVEYVPPRVPHFERFLNDVVGRDAHGLRRFRSVVEGIWQEAPHDATFACFEHWPQLEELELVVHRLVLQNVRAPALRRLVLKVWHRDASLAAVVEGALPALEELELTRFPVEGLTPLLAVVPAPSHLGRLRRLVLRETESTDALVRALATSPLLPHLEELDLAGGDLTDAGARMLCDGAFAHLQVRLQHDQG